MTTRQGKYATLCCLLGLLLIIPPVHADYIAPATTHVYFEKDGAPYNGSVQYSVDCYGYTALPDREKPAGSYAPERVFHYTASCGGYGCAIYEPYYLQYTHIDWCDLEGDAGGQPFTLRNFSKTPYSRCDYVENRVVRMSGEVREYYYTPPEYELCLNRAGLPPDYGTGHRRYTGSYIPVNRTAVLLLPGHGPLYRILPNPSPDVTPGSGTAMGLDRYIAYLETCDPAADPGCGGWIVDGRPLKTLTEYRPFRSNATHLRDHPCDTFLVSAESSLVMPFVDDEPWHHVCWGACNVTEDLCELHITIPSAVESALVSGNVSPGPENRAPISGPKSAGARQSPVESLYCSILSFFGVAC